MEQNLTPATFTQNEGQLPAVQASASENSAIAMAALQKATVEARYKMALARPRDQTFPLESFRDGGTS